MRPALVFGVLVLIGTLGLGSLWLRAVDALVPRVLDSRAAERAMHKTLNNFEAVLQGRRHMVQPPASQGPTTTRSALWCGHAVASSPSSAGPGTDTPPPRDP